MAIRKTRSQFILDAQKIFGNEYDYSRTEYTTSKNKVVVICPIHGEFKVTPSNHLTRNTGCAKCSSIKGGKKKTETGLARKYKGIIQPSGHKIIPLTRGKFAIVDNEVFEAVKGINWCCTVCSGYLYAWHDTHGLMHRYIMNCPKDMLVDHKNHNTLDNRKENIRICTTSQNGMNKRPLQGCTSQYKGVTWNKKTNKWDATITLDKKGFYLGSFSFEHSAAKAYDRKATELFGEFALLNLPK